MREDAADGDGEEADASIVICAVPSRMRAASLDLGGRGATGMAGRRGAEGLGTEEREDERHPGGDPAAGARAARSAAAASRTKPSIPAEWETTHIGDAKASTISAAAPVLSPQGRSSGNAARLRPPAAASTAAIGRRTVRAVPEGAALPTAGAADVPVPVSVSLD